MRKPGSRTVIKTISFAVVAALSLGGKYLAVKYIPPTAVRDWFCVEDTESFELA